MGNTKMVYFDGELLPSAGDLEHGELRAKLRANYLSRSVYPGRYLAPKEDGFFVVGAYETHSMSSRVEPVAELLEYGTIVRYDSDWPDVIVYDVSNGKVVGAKVFKLSHEEDGGEDVLKGKRADKVRIEAEVGLTLRVEPEGYAVLLANGVALGMVTLGTAESEDDLAGLIANEAPLIAEDLMEKAGNAAEKDAAEENTAEGTK